jgi:hypothetical protein
MLPVQYLSAECFLRGCSSHDPTFKYGGSEVALPIYFETYGFCYQLKVVNDS